MRSISKQLMLAMIGILLVFGGIIVTVLVVEMSGHKDSVEELIQETAQMVMDASEPEQRSEEEQARIAEMRKDPIAYAMKREKELEAMETPKTNGSDMLLVSLMLSESSSEFNKKIIRYIIISFLIAIVVSNMLIYLLSRRIAKPIRELAAQAAIVGSGDLDHPIRVDAKNEVGQLAESFQLMTDELKKHMEQMQQDTAVREHELASREAAGQIMTSVQPGEFYAREDFELYAKSLQIEESGGDFYDFAMIDKTHLAFVLGDVKGKGLTAALVAVLVGTYIKNFTKIGYHPGRVMAEANNGICAMKSLNMTVAAFLGILDLATGELSYASAGMEAPLWKHAGDDFTFLEGSESFRLGSMENVSFKNEMVRLTQGDILALYTEGISRAKNDKELEYTGEYLEQSLGSIVTKQIHSEAIVNEAMRGVEEFIGDRKQDDDGSMMVLRYFGSVG